MIRLSIIVPMYKVEPYVERCLRSLEDQDLPKDAYEIICINDGSPDNSREVVLGLQKEFGNIILIDQENQGVSVARNNGIDVARGEYIIMVDADDFIEPDILIRNLTLLKQYDLEVGYTGYIILDESSNEEFRYDPFYDLDLVLTGIDFLKKYRRDKLDLVERDPHRSAGIFFKSSYLNSNRLRYLSDVPFLEDGELMARIMCLSSRVGFINGPVYKRTTRPGSATQSSLYNSERARNGFLNAANNLLRFKRSSCRNEEQRIFINQSIVHFTILVFTSLEVMQYLRSYSQLSKTLKTGPLKTLETEGCCDFYRKMGNNYNYSIHFFYLNWQLFRFRKSLGIKLRRLFSVWHSHDIKVQ